VADATAASSRVVATVLLAVVLFVAPLSGAGAQGSDTERGWVVEQVRFQPVDGTTFDVAGVGTYRGGVEVMAGEGGLLTVNDVALEDYVKGVAEMPPSWPLEAQKAQAIAARTYALHQVLSHRAQDPPPPADICDSQACQVYVGTASEHRQHGINWVNAVEQTAGQVMLNGGKIMFTQYSSTNGGRTVQGSREYLWAVDDPDDAASPYHQWRVGYPLAEIAGLVGFDGVLTGAHRGGDEVVLTGTAPDGSEREVRLAAADLRSRMNGHFPKPADLPLPVPSMRFTVWVDGDQMLVDGRGWGHGVGMSQYGALGKARRGMAAPDILAAYYGGIRPSQVEPERLPERIRVAVAEPAASVGISSVGTFEVLDQAGEPLVLVGQGNWLVEPAPGGVRVIPPDGYDQPLRADSVAVDPPEVRAKRGEVRFELDAPAAVRIVMTGPSGKGRTITDRTLEPGAHRVALDAPRRGGRWQLVVEAVAGVDRRTTVPVDLDLRAGKPTRTKVRAATTEPAVDLTSASPPGRAIAGSAAVLVLLLAVAALFLHVLHVRGRRAGAVHS
jgi:stage II sporulation protein D